MQLWEQSVCLPRCTCLPAFVEHVGAATATTSSNGAQAAQAIHAQCHLDKTGMPPLTTCVCSIGLSTHLPGRRSAGSSASGLFVAPISTTLPLLSRPSMRANRVDTMLLCTWSCLLVRTCMHRMAVKPQKVPRLHSPKITPAGKPHV